MKMPEQCFECEKGQLVEIVQDYTDEGPDGASVVVPSVKMLRCTGCGEELIPAESNRYISRYVAEANEQLTKAPDGASVVVPSVKMQTNRGLISATKQDHD